jgi:hypothetical protein
MSQALERSILEAVAKGELSPEAALEQLEPARNEALVLPTQERLVPRPRIRLTVNGDRLEIVGREDVDLVEDEGPIRCRVDSEHDPVNAFCESRSDGVVYVNSRADLELWANGADTTISGLEGSLRGVINCGNLEISGRLRADSRLEANAGDVHLWLAEDSDVTVVVRAACEVHADTGFAKVGRGRYRLGSGRVAFEIDGNMGDVHLHAI